MMSVILLIWAIISIAVSTSEGATLKFRSPTLQAHVALNDNGHFVSIDGPPSRSAISQIEIALDTNTTGWNYVHVWTNGSYNDETQAYSAGFLEATKDPLVRLHYRNTMEGQCRGPTSSSCKKLHTYLTTNLKFMKREIISKRRVDPFWHQVELLLWQIQGMDDGFKKKSMRHFADLTPEKLDLDPFGMFFWHVKGGDMDELSEALKSPSERKSLEERVKSFGHCSALIKQTRSGQLFVAQDTWNGYESMLRHMKLYEFNYHETAIPTSKFAAGGIQSFSSYPGSVVSGDDFYVLGSRMVTQETTNGFYNSTLYDIIRNSADKVVFEFLRTQVANRLARNISDWQKYFAKRNSGTYNNQWMVVDYKKAILGQSLPAAGVLGISEQLPGLVVSKDMTQHLRNTSYWPSYNTPAFQEIYEYSNLTAMVKKYGNFFTYNLTARALIFKRDNGKVIDLPTMIRLMRYNDFKHDKLAKCKCSPPYTGEYAISARSDLNPANGTYPFGALGHRNHGGTDMKLATSWLLNDMSFIGVSSPTYDQQPPFRWSTSGFRVAHFGQPDLWNFKPIITPWRRIRGYNPKEKTFQMNPKEIIVIPY